MQTCRHTDKQTYICIYIHIFSIYICICCGMYRCIYLNIHVAVYISIYTYIHINICRSIHLSTNLPEYARIWRCVQLNGVSTFLLLHPFTEFANLDLPWSSRSPRYRRQHHGAPAGLNARMPREGDFGHRFGANGLAACLGVLKRKDAQSRCQCSEPMLFMIMLRNVPLCSWLW